MEARRPNKTLTDYLVIGISPGLIMALVGSLCFFLIEVFFRGAAAASVRWVMFWFVLAVVLVARIGIEQGTSRAAAYGLTLAVATWLYLMRIHPAFILGIILLGVIWWCAHKLVWDCTLIDEDEDSSGSGLLESVAEKKSFVLLDKKTVTKSGKKNQGEAKPAAPHPPGLWVVYFSLAALPLFGIGQVLLPKGDLASRHAGFVYLLVYMAAAFGLLLTTSFLGLRRYLRQRHVPMPGIIALGWIRFGGGVAVFILITALFLPRPGVGEAWQTLRYKIDYRLHQASEYALRFNPHGKGDGRSGNESHPTGLQKNQTANSQPQNQAVAGKTPGAPTQNSQPNQNGTSPAPSSEAAAQLFHWLRILFLLALALIAGWWVFRQRNLIFEAAKSVLEAIADFFRNLFGLGFLRKSAAAMANQPARIHRPFGAFENPFLTGKENLWTQAQLILYSYEALRAWAQERGVEPRPEQTAREFCAELANRFPEINGELNRLSAFYTRTAYGVTGFANQNLEPVKQLWRYLYFGEKQGAD